jgi:hypothetical protein
VTGTGKTETMLSVLVFAGCSRVFVVVPTDALRTQKTFCGGRPSGRVTVAQRDSSEETADWSRRCEGWPTVPA